MLRFGVLLLALALAFGLRAAGQAAQSMLHEQRSSPGDLEVGGELKGLPAGSTRYVRRADLLRLALETDAVSDDSNLKGPGFKNPAQVRGVALETLERVLGASGEGLMAVAICSDRYRANYPRDYVAAHHPVVVLEIDGQGPEHWPPSEYGGPLGPYLISHPFFKPAFKVLSHEDEPQVPFSVTRIEFRSQARVYGAIRPPGEWAAGSPVEQGYTIARQDCFRCHNMGAEGGTMAGESWIELGTMAAGDAGRFRQTIHDPASLKRDAKMPAHTDYDAATLDALTAYFRTFAVKVGGGSR